MLSEQYPSSTRHVPLTTWPLQHCEKPKENNSKIIFVSVGANKRFSKYLISRNMDTFFGKLKFTNDFGIL